MFLNSGHAKPGQPAGPQTQAGGRLEQRFRKRLIGIGHFVKPADNIEFDVTRRTLEHFAEQFRRMKANGVQVPVPDGHKNAGSADHNRGYVEDMFIEGDSLVGVLRMIGPDAIAAAQRCDVSIFAPPVLIDGRGNRYERPIEHVALCTDPVVPGLGEFIPLAASKGGSVRPAQTEPGIIRDARRRALVGELADLHAIAHGSPRYF